MNKENKTEKTQEKTVKSRKAESNTRKANIRKFKERATLRRLGPLHTDTEEGFRTRWVTDKLDRLKQMQEYYGYEFCTDENGNKITRNTRVGSEAVTIYKMKQPEEIHEAIQEDIRAARKKRSPLGQRETQERDDGLYSVKV